MTDHHLFKTAGFWPRMAALLIDTAGIFLAFDILITPVRIMFPGAMKVIAVVFLTVLGLYFLFRDAWLKGGLGKRLMHLQTITDKEGAEVQPCGIGQSFIRNIFLLIPIFAILEMWVVIFRHDKKRIGDFLASTRVVKIPQHSVTK